MSSSSKLKQAADTSVIWRLLFATSILPADTTDLWETVAKFDVAKSDASLLPEQGRVIADIHHLHRWACFNAWWWTIYRVDYDAI